MLWSSWSWWSLSWSHHDHVDLWLGVELDINDNVIPAEGRKVIRVKIRPYVRGQHTLELKYRLEIPIIGKKILYCHLINKGVIGGSTIDEQSLCSIVFNAVYPNLSVTSVLGDGSLTDLSKSRLWNMLSIDQLVIYSILLIIQYIVHWPVSDIQYITYYIVYCPLTS